MNNDFSNFGDHATASVTRGAGAGETFGMEGRYDVICHDANGNLKWTDYADNLVTAEGKQLMFDTFLKGSAYTVVGPFLGLTKVSLTPLQADTMTTLVTTNAGEFINYTNDLTTTNVRATLTFGAATNNGTASPSNVVTSAATGVTFTITGAGGTVYGCFLTTGTGAVATQSAVTGKLYSEGNFSGGSKVVTSGDKLTVTYSTTATS
jgi:hypothetical protein